LTTLWHMEVTHCDGGLVLGDGRFHPLVLNWLLNLCLNQLELKINLVRVGHRRKFGLTKASDRRVRFFHVRVWFFLIHFSQEVVWSILNLYSVC
jgi:hypothetical protein